MPTNPLVDKYIQNAQPFAQPIIQHLRKLVHQACPTVEENIKWGMPSFEYKGLMCGFAAFKNHCTFGFWKASLMSDPTLMQNAKTEDSMGHLGRITSLKDLPSDKTIIGYIKEAMKLNDDGIKVVKAKPITVKELIIPDDIIATIKTNKKALETFNAFSPSNKREYLDWINEAKTQATKEKRLDKAIEWMAEGKPRNWKYIKQHN
ncbi:MAG: YdeI/OmpD-associated family protein [Chitinophagaceae bacterium]